LRRVREWAGLNSELVPHALRKSAVTVVADALGIEGAAQFAGHKRSRVTEQYYAKRAVQAPDTSHALGALQQQHAPKAPMKFEKSRRAVGGYRD
jgi:integrase